MFDEIQAMLGPWSLVCASGVAIASWWIGTSVVLLIDGLPRAYHRGSLIVAGVWAIVAFGVLILTRTHTTPAAAYVAFFCTIVVWGWNELAFLTGRITGPRRSACPRGCSGIRHVGHAIATVLHHEIAIAACGAAIFAVTWGSPNTVGFWTYAVLWVMRLSAKLNLFLGVPNLSEELLPVRLRYLERYFNRRPMNVLFPLSITFGTVATAWLAQQAMAADAAPHTSVGYGLTATLMALAVLEHWFLVLPIPTTALWRLGLRSHGSVDPPRMLRPKAGTETHPIRTSPAQPVRASKSARSHDA